MLRGNGRDRLLPFPHITVSWRKSNFTLHFYHHYSITRSFIILLSCCVGEFGLAREPASETGQNQPPWSRLPQHFLPDHHPLHRPTHGHGLHGSVLLRVCGEEGEEESQSVTAGSREGGKRSVQLCLFVCKLKVLQFYFPKCICF